MFVAFNSTFMPLFVLGMEGMPRRVSTYAPNLQTLNVWVSISAFVLGFSMLIFLVQRRLLADLRAGESRVQPVALEVDRVAGADAGARQQLRADPRVRLRPLRLRHARRPPRRRTAGRGGGIGDGSSPSEELPLGLMVPPVPAGVEIPPEPPDVGARALSVAARLLCGATTFFFLAFLFAYFYLRSINQDHMWRPAHVKPDQGLGRGLHRLRGAERGARDRRRAPDEGATRAAGSTPAIGGVVLGLVGVGAAVHRVHQPALRPHRRRLRERVLRLDGLLPDRGARHDVLARDPGRHRAPRPPPAGRRARATSRTPTA